MIGFFFLLLLLVRVRIKKDRKEITNTYIHVKDERLRPLFKLNGKRVRANHSVGFVYSGQREVNAQAQHV